jgi:hypothetical protein
VQQYGASVTGIGEPERVQTLLVTHGALNALGTMPLRGHWLTEAEDTPGSTDTVILSYGYWQRRFGGDEAVIGRTITLDSRAHVIGIMPPDFPFSVQASYQSSDAAMILPMRLDRNKRGLGSFGFSAWRDSSPESLCFLRPPSSSLSPNRPISRVK